MAIEWLEVPGYVPISYNPMSGCSPLSEGCGRCWAKRTAETRLRGRAGYDKDEPFKITFHRDRLGEPGSWKKPHSCFVVSMGDLFHSDVPDDFIDSVMNVMMGTPHHLYFVLTKRAKRMADYMTERSEFFKRLRHVWFGVTVENQKRADERIPELLRLPTSNLFLSIEPMLGPVDLMMRVPTTPDNFFHTIKWVIVGGESGEGCRPMDLDWVRPIRDLCTEAKCAFYFKQLGGYSDQKERAKALLDGKLHKEFPDFGGSHA